jgi:hypothetical protein
MRAGEGADASPANKTATEQAWKRLLAKLAAGEEDRS